MTKNNVANSVIRAHQAGWYCETCDKDLGTGEQAKEHVEHTHHLAPDSIWAVDENPTVIYEEIAVTTISHINLDGCTLTHTQRIRGII